MKIAILALIGNAAAQLTFCSESEPCPAETIPDGGCCQTMEAVAVPEDPTWGFVQSGPFQGGDMVVGAMTNICMNGAMVKCRADAEAASAREDGSIGNDVDLQCFLDSNPGIDTVLGLDGNTLDDLYAGWETDAETNEAFFLRTYCVAGALKMAASGAAMAATAYFTL